MDKLCVHEYLDIVSLETFYVKPLLDLDKYIATFNISNGAVHGHDALESFAYGFNIDEPDVAGDDIIAIRKPDPDRFHFVTETTKIHTPRTLTYLGEWDMEELLTEKFNMNEKNNREFRFCMYNYWASDNKEDDLYYF